MQAESRPGNMKDEIIKNDCRYFRGDMPCRPHKEKGYHCKECPVYDKTTGKILIIKLGAIGDVIRTTPLLHRIKKEHPQHQIFWLTESPGVLSSNYIDRILKSNTENIELLKNLHFDWVLNLDKDALAISLMKRISADHRSGFTMDDFGHCVPLGSKAAHHKWLTGLFDDLNKTNSRHYVEEIFDIAGYEFKGEEYILEDKMNKEWDIDQRKTVVGLNTGCGDRWLSRLWPEEHWTKLAKTLRDQEYEVILLGGAAEDEKNRRLAKAAGVKYLGHFDLKTFINEVNQVDVVVTAVTMATHIAIGLKKQLVLFNNIFNKNEFHLYKRGEILEPDIECDCYFAAECPNNCMEHLLPETVISAVGEAGKRIGK